MKKLINAADDVVADSLAGLAAAHPGRLRVSTGPRYVARGDAPVRGKVALVSGGGSGHEPMHTGFVGRGMLDAACPGEVFTSPTPDQMAGAAKAVDGGAGVLFIVKNYTGDVMNFEMAAELAGDDGVTTASVVIDDDVAVENSTYTAGRRGVGTTVLAEKICGAAAERGDSVLAFVNSMGATPLMELYVVYRDLERLLGSRGVRIDRSLIGPYMTSLDMAGCSITLLRLDQELTELWDAPVDTPGLRWG